MDPLPLVVCGAAAALYALGRRGKPRIWREVSFYSGVALAFVVLERPFDDWADRWLSVHMSQHIVLMTVGPPVAAHVAAVPALRAPRSRRHALALALVPPQRGTSEAPGGRSRRAVGNGRRLARAAAVRRRCKQRMDP